jgi:hypothetical protein
VLGPPLLLLVLFELSDAVLLLLVSVLLQPIRMAAHKIEKIKRDFLNIGFCSFQVQLKPTWIVKSRDRKAAV